MFPWRRSALLLRVVAILSCCVLLLSQTATSVQAMGVSLKQAVRQYLRRPGRFTQAPRAAFVGETPGRDPHGRGGIWNTQLLAEAPESRPWIASTVFTGGHTSTWAAEAGGAYPWEGSYAGLNTGTGNKLTRVPLFSWSNRGGLPIEFALYHNSLSNDEDELGRGWTWTFDVYVNNQGSNPVLHWGDGTSIPFSPSMSVFGAYDAPAGIHDQLGTDTSGNWMVTRKDGTVYHFNASGFLSSVVDRNGNAFTLTLNASNFVTKVTDATGRHLDISVSAGGKFQSVTDPGGHTWTFTLNGSDDLTTVTWPTLGGVSYADGFTYNSVGQILTHTDRNGHVWTLTYDTSGNLASETDPLSHTTTYGYTSSAATVTDALSHTRTDNYSSGALASQVDPSGFSVSYTARNTNHDPTTVVDARGKTHKFTYDSLGNVLTDKDPLLHTTTYTYNGFSEPLTVTDALSHTVTNTYDSAGNLLTTTDPLSHTQTTNTYGTYGLLATTTDALSHSSSFTYDTNGSLSTVTDPLSNTVTFGYDAMGRLTSTTDPLTHVESVSYDVWGRPTTYTHADSTYSTKAYDAVGNVTSVTDENGHSSTMAYDNANRLSSVTNAKSETESYTYDAGNRRTAVTNGRGKTRTYTFTDRGDVSTLTMPDSSVESWSYDGAGNVTAYTNPLSQTILYTFDDAGRETLIDYPAGTDTSFGYDNANRRTSMTDATGSTGWTYDNASRLTALTTPQGNLSYTYDNANRKSTMVDSTGTTTYGYDNANHLASLQNPLGETTSWTYDAAGRTTQQTFSSGMFDTYGYDSRNRETSVTHKNSSGTAISSESYVYDGANNLSSKTVDSVTTTYGYDNIDQLLSESRTGYSASYTYDANGNRASKTLGGVTDTYHVDDADKLTSITQGATTVKSYTYDTAGRTTGVTTSAGTTTLAYDYEGRVKTITYPSLATNTFTYNGLDTRVGKVDSAGTATYRRDGVDVTAPVLSDASATYTPGISERRSGTTTEYLNDRLGSTTRQTNTSATTTGTRTYDAFGLLVSTTGTPKGPFGFAGAHGYQEDLDSGLKLLGHRYYDPSTGRFITRDPVKQGRNWYAYCDGNPLAALDVTGHGWRATVGGFVGGFIGGALSGGNPLGIAIGVGIGTAIGDAGDQASTGENPDWGDAAGKGIEAGAEALLFELAFIPVGISGIGGAGALSDFGGGNGCFAAGTLVRMADGTAKPIEQVHVGDKVLSRSAKGSEPGKTNPDRVNRTLIHSHAESLLLQFVGGGSIHTTKEHPFFLRDKGFISASRLHVGDQLVGLNKTSRIISQVSIVKGYVNVYNLEVDRDHTYFVKAGKHWLWVHNTCLGPNELDGVPGNYLGTKGGKPYVGQASNLADRPWQKNHLDPGTPIQIFEYPNSTRTDREIVEQIIINDHGGLGNMGNKRNPVGGRPWLWPK